MVGGRRCLNLRQPSRRGTYGPDGHHCHVPSSIEEHKLAAPAFTGAGPFLSSNVWHRPIGFEQLGLPGRLIGMFTILMRADNRTMPPRRTGLARGGVQSLQDQSKPAAGRHPPAACHAHLEARGLSQMPVMPQGALSTTGADDQADRRARNHTLQVGPSGRGA